MAESQALTGPHSQSQYVIKRSFWSFLGRVFRVFAPDGSLAMYIKHPFMKLRDEFTIFADEGETSPILKVKARQIVALNVARDVFDSATGVRLGAIRSRGLKSLVRDTWDILDASDTVIGLMQEDGAAMLRRFFPILTSKHHIELNGETVATIRQRFRFFVKEFELDVTQPRLIDPRFAVACGLLALMAESQREG